MPQPARSNRSATSRIRRGRGLSSRKRTSRGRLLNPHVSAFEAAYGKTEYMFSDVSPENISASATYTGTAAFAFNAPTTITMNTNESWYCTFSGPLFRTSRNTTPTRTPMSIALPKIARRTSRFLRASRASRGEQHSKLPPRARHARLTRARSRGGDRPRRRARTRDRDVHGGAHRGGDEVLVSTPQVVRNVDARGATLRDVALSLLVDGGDEIERVLRDRDPRAASRARARRGSPRPVSASATRRRRRRRRPES